MTDLKQPVREEIRAENERLEKERRDFDQYLAEAVDYARRSNERWQRFGRGLVDDAREPTKRRRW